MKKHKVLFLYTEIAEYFLACCKALLLKDCEVHIIRYPVNKEAPFQFSFPEGIKVYDRNKYNTSQLLKLISEISPSIIICSGWIDKGYLKVCRQFKNKAITVLTLDNHWRGNLKQKIASIISPFYFHTRFSFCWVPGDFQYEYALHLGFKKENIATGFYSADVDLFQKEYLANKEQKQKLFPKRFIYVGRYYEFKGIKDMWQAFIELQNGNPNDWELWCFGTGDLEPVNHPKIKHLGFVQPNDLTKYIKDTGVFVLPSHFEPWGVVVHEFTAAGFPVICTNEVGARGAFVENDFNGYVYKAGNVNQLKEVLKKTMNKSDSELFLMAERSAKKALEITPQKWADTILKLINTSL